MGHLKSSKETIWVLQVRKIKKEMPAQKVGAGKKIERTPH